MSTDEKKQLPAPPQRPMQKMPRRFGPPAELTPDLGVLAASEEYIQGIVSTENLPRLLDAFAVPPRHGMTMPFQHIVKQHGEFGSLRIEASALHTVDDAPIVGHQWAYCKDQPGHTAQPM